MEYRAVYQVLCVIPITAADEDDAYNQLGLVTQAQVLEHIVEYELLELTQQD